MDGHSSLSNELVLGEDNFKATNNLSKLLTYFDCDSMFAWLLRNLFNVTDRNHANTLNIYTTLDLFCQNKLLLANAYCHLVKVY